jgi:DUF971 family protein
MTDPKIRPTKIRSPRGAKSTEIDWADGHKGVYPHEILRGYCPCAGCQGHSGTITFQNAEGIALEVDDIEPVGNYAVCIKWFDGHSSGIYSFKYLRQLCQCAECAPSGATHEPRARV